jgi:hypothetical protein
MKAGTLYFWLLQGLLAGFCHALTVELDFSYDAATENFFGTTPMAKAAVQAAANDINAAIGAKLGAVNTNVFARKVGVTTATFTWSLTFKNPSTGNLVTFSKLSFPADTVRIYVGMQPFSGGETEIGRGGPGGANVNLNGGGLGSEWISTIQAAGAASDASMKRGAGPLIGKLAGSSALGSATANYSLGYGSFVGSVWFDNDTDNDSVTDSAEKMAAYWHYDPNTPVAPGKQDFYSVALHEMLHALGLGSSQTWSVTRSGTTWNGPGAKALNGGSGTKLISPDFAHLASGFMSTRISDGAAQEAVMDPSLTAGTRKYLTAMDLALMSDMGYTIGRAPLVATGSASVLSNIVAVLSGAIEDNGAPTTVSFEYGLTTKYGTIEGLPAIIPIPNVSIPVPVTLRLSNLQPGQTYHYRLYASNSGGTTHGSDAVFKTPSLIEGPALVCDGAPMSLSPFKNGQYPGMIIGAFTQGKFGNVTSNGAEIVYTPGYGYFGLDTFEFTVVSSNPVPLPAEAPFKVGTTVKLSPPPLPAIVALKGGPVTGMAVATYNTLGVPATGAFSGILEASGAKPGAIFLANGAVALRVGGNVQDLAETVTFSKLGEPSGQAVLATLKTAAPLVSAKTDSVLITGLSGGGPLRVAAREGIDLAPSGLPGVSIKSFGAFDGNGPAVFFLASLQGLNVTGKTDAALCVVRADGSLRVLLREQDTVNGKPVAVIGSLVGLAGTLADGRWRAGQEAIGVRLTFGDKSQAIYCIPASAVSPADFKALARSAQILAGGPLAGAQLQSLDLPGFGPEGGAAFAAKLKTGIPGVTAANDSALFFAEGGQPRLIAQERGQAPGADGLPFGPTFKSFGAPVVGAQKKVAFTGVLAGTGVTAANNAGIWLAQYDGGGTRLLARAGAVAPGALGGRFLKFLSLAMDDGALGGPVFLATLATDKAVPISAKNNLGLWALNSSGILQKVLQTGQPVPVNGANRVLSKFVALAAAPGSIGAAHGYDGARHLAVLATFEDHSVALLEIVVP